MRRYRIRVDGDELHFAAAHFITYEDGDCEALHGHNYRVAVTAEGPLNAAAYVFDFVELKARAVERLSGLDHRLLLPERNDRLHVEEEGEEVRARCGDHRYVFPASDVRILPVSNTTAEAVASWLVGELLEALQVSDGGGAGDGSGPELTRLEVTVEESPGQRATCTWAPDAKGSPPRP